jgi:hypothetical protein
MSEQQARGAAASFSHFTHKQVSPASRFYKVSSQWRHYEEMDSLPEGLLVSADSVAAFNPLYGCVIGDQRLSTRGVGKGGSLCCFALNPGRAPTDCLNAFLSACMFLTEATA